MPSCWCFCLRWMKRCWLMNCSWWSVSWSTALGLLVHHEETKYVSTEFLDVYPVKTRVTVKCLVRHPALHDKTLMSFVKIGRDSEYSLFRLRLCTSHFSCLVFSSTTKRVRLNVVCLCNMKQKRAGPLFSFFSYVAPNSSRSQLLLVSCPTLCDF